MRAFQRAIDVGCAIELDMQLTADGTMVVTHDNSQKRITGVDVPKGSYISPVQIVILATITVSYAIS